MSKKRTEEEENRMLEGIARLSRHVYRAIVHHIEGETNIVVMGVLSQSVLLALLNMSVEGEFQEVVKDFCSLLTEGANNFNNKNKL